VRLNRCGAVFCCNSSSVSRSCDVSASLVVMVVMIRIVAPRCKVSGCSKCLQQSARTRTRVLILDRSPNFWIRRQQQELLAKVSIDPDEFVQLEVRALMCPFVPLAFSRDSIQTP
jgi:hypothetical protein